MYKTKGNALLALLVLIAAAVHLYVVPEHFSEYRPAGLFFIVVTLLQVGAALVVLIRPSKAVYQVIIWSAVALLLVWAISRTVGMPMGDEWEVEPVGALDLITRFVELGAAVLAGFFLRQRALPAPRH